MRSKFTKKGEPCGFVTIEDFEGSGELALFGEEWGHWRGMLTEGCSVYVRAKFSKRFATSTFIETRITDIQYLETVKNQSIEKFTIVCDTAHLDETVITDIVTLVSESPGTTQLFFQLNDSEHNTNLLLRSRNGSINLDRHLVQYIESSEHLSYKVN